MKTKILALALVCILTSYMQAYSAEDENPHKKAKLTRIENSKSYQIFISYKDNIVKMIGWENYENSENLTLSKLNLGYSSRKDRVVPLACLLLDFCTSLKELILHNNNINDEGMKDISSVMKNLTRLNLSENEISEKGARYLDAALMKNKTLTDLNLEGNQIGDEGTLYICKSLGNIRTLDLGWNGITAKGVQFLSDGLEKSMVALIDLNLEGNSIGDEGTRYIRKSLGNTRTLNLGWNGITAKGVQFLSDGPEKSMTALTDLDLGGNPIGDEGAQYIRKILETNKYLITMKLVSIEIGNLGAEHLIEALRGNKTLKNLDLDNNLISNKGGQLIGGVLESLNLEGNSIGSKGAQHIGETLNINKTLKMLCLNENKIGDEGMQFIREALKTNKTLIDVALNCDGIENNIENSIEDQIYKEVAFNRKMQLFWLPQCGEEGNYKKKLLSSRVYEDVVFTQRLNVESYYPA